MGKYHSELLMLFNLAFLMKCKYILHDNGVNNITLIYFKRALSMFVLTCICVIILFKGEIM